MNSYVGLFLIRNNGNNFLTNLFQLECDEIGYVVGEMVVVVDLFPNLKPLSRSTVIELLRRDSAQVLYRKIKLGSDQFESLIEERFKNFNPARTIIDQFQAFSSDGINFHNRFMSEIEFGIVSNDLVPIYPSIFEADRVILSSTKPDRCKRQDLIELFIRFPDLYKKREVKAQQSVIHRLLNHHSQLISFLTGPSFREGNELVALSKELSSTYQAIESIFKIKTPQITITRSPSDRLTILVHDGSFKRALQELHTIAEQIKAAILQPEMEPKLYINRLIHNLDIISGMIGLEEIGEVEKVYSQKIWCISNTENFKIRYESDRSIVRIPLSGEGLEQLNEKELHQLLEWIDDHLIINPALNEFRKLISLRISSK